VRRSLHPILAALFCALTIPPSAIPVWNLALSSRPGLAIPYRRVARRAVEEVGSRPIDPSPPHVTKLSPAVFVHSERDAVPFASRFTENDITDWLLSCLLHRRTSPPSTDDGN
jgi:hypothetical protein